MKYPSTHRPPLAVLLLWAIPALAQSSPPFATTSSTSSLNTEALTTPSFSALLSSSFSSTPTNLIGPLTTIFTPPASCITNEAITTANVNSTQSPIYSTQSLFNNGPSGAQMVRSECFPSKYSHIEWSYYSPGVCPSGWVLNSALSIQQRFVAFTTAGETVGICCPPRYTFVDGPVGCTSYLAQTTSGSVLLPSYFVKFQNGMPYTAEVPQTLTVSDATVTITENVLSTLITSAVYSSSQVPPVTVQEPEVLSTILTPTTYISISTVLMSEFVCIGGCGVSFLFGATSELVTQRLTTLTQTISSEFLYSEITASPLYTTSNIAPGVVWASGIQIRWTGSYPPTQSRGYTPGQKAGITLGIIISLAFLTVFVLWRRRIYRFKNRRNASHNPIQEAGVEESHPRELPDTRLIRTASETVQVYPLNRPATPLEIRNEVSTDRWHATLVEIAHQPPMTATTDSTMAEIGSVTSIRRKPVQPITAEAPAQVMAEEQPKELETTIPSSSSKDTRQPTVTVSEVQPPQMEEQPEQISIAALSTGEGSTSSRRETTSELGDEEGIRVELARVVERKQRVREMQKLKEEEESLERREEELLGRLKARGGNGDR